MINGKFDYLDDSGISVKRVCSLDDDISKNSVFYATRWSTKIYQKIQGATECILILLPKAKEQVSSLEKNNKIIYSDNPRLEYAILLEKIIQDDDSKRFGILDNDYEYEKKGYVKNTRSTSGEGTMVSPFTFEYDKIGVGTIIEPFVYIDSDVRIGDNCIIQSGARIYRNVVIGDNVTIKANSVIGSHGFGVEKDKDGKTYMIPHIGGVVIEDNVQIGALTTVCSGTINPTVIGEHTKIDDHVHIGHNVKIGKSVIVTACAEICRSDIDDEVWIGPNSSIIQGVKIGKKALIGIGSVVTKDIAAGSVVAGNPAENIETLRLKRKYLKELLNE